MEQVVAIAVFLMALTACSTTTPGTPIAERSQAGSETSLPTTGNGDSTDKEKALDALGPCDLITPEVRTEFGIDTDADFEKFPSSRSCNWNGTPPGLTGRFALSYGIFAKLGVDKISARSEKKEITINGRRAISAIGGAGNIYTISLEVTPTSRVDVLFSGGQGRTPVEQMWKQATRLAELVEPKIP